MPDIYDGTAIVTGDEGPPGPPGRGGIGLSFTNGYHGSEALPGFAVVYPLLADGPSSRFVSLVKPTATVIFVVRKNGTRVGVATMDPLTCGAGPVFKGVVAFDALTNACSFAVEDYADWVAPGGVDATFISGACTLGSLLP